MVLHQSLQRNIVAFIHKVEMALDPFSNDRGEEAGRRGRWWGVGTTERLEKARVKTWLCTGTAAETAKLLSLLARYGLATETYTSEDCKGWHIRGGKS